MLARRIEPPLPPSEPENQRRSAAARAEGRWRTQGYRPTRGPHGPVRWWERAAPRGDEQLWAAVRRLQARRITLDASVAGLARALAQQGQPISRETLSRVLNGKQATSWETVERLAYLLGVDLGAHGPDVDPPDGPQGAA